MNLLHGLETWNSPWLFRALLGGGLFVGLVMVGAILPRLNTTERPLRRRKPGLKK
jgi:hypothetical protein